MPRTAVEPTFAWGPTEGVSGATTDEQLKLPTHTSRKLQYSGR
jgi:hypothetical protein